MKFSIHRLWSGFPWTLPSSPSLPLTQKSRSFTVISGSLWDSLFALFASLWSVTLNNLCSNGVMKVLPFQKKIGAKERQFRNIIFFPSLYSYSSHLALFPTRLFSLFIEALLVCCGKIGKHRRAKGKVIPNPPPVWRWPVWSTTVSSPGCTNTAVSMSSS